MKAFLFNNVKIMKSLYKLENLSVEIILYK